MSEAKPGGKRRLFTGRTGILLLLLIGLAAVAAYRLKDRWYMRGNFMPAVADATFEESQKELEASRASQNAALARAADHLIEGAPSWPRYRGANEDGIAVANNLLQPWPQGGPPIQFRQPIGSGYAGFAIGGGRAYTIEQRRGKEAITCYDFETGIELWAFEYKARFEETMGGEGPRATPTLDGDRLYSLGAQGDLYCLSAVDGSEIWNRDILDGIPNLQWGMAGSPLVLGDRVLVTNSGMKGDSILALDKMTGKTIWTSVPEQQGYSSLQLAELNGRSQVLNLAARNLNSVDPESGKLLWSFPWDGPQNGINVAQPIPTGPDLVFISTGYGKGCALLQLRPSDSGFEVTQLWANTNMKNKFNSSILYRGYIYGLDEGVMACINAADGSKAWKAGRYGHGQILIADDQLYVLGEQGDLTLLALDPKEHRVLGSFQPLHGKTWNNMAFAGGRLLIRNNREMACLDLRNQPPFGIETTSQAAPAAATQNGGEPS